MKRKEKCEECGRTLRFSSLVRNKLTNKLVCRRCDNKLGSNKFYSPIKSRENRRINNFNITDLEKKVLLMGKGKKDVDYLCKQLKKISKQRRSKRKEINSNNEIKKKEQIEKQKKFIEGLM